MDEAQLEVSSPARRKRWVTAISLIVVAIAGLAAWAVLSPGALAYYKTPSEVATLRSDSMHTYRIGGRMVKGSLVRAGTIVHFSITDGKVQIPISYTGDVPDTLKDGTDVVAEGHFTSDGTLRATRVLAKCSSRFVPKNRPGDLGKA